jgi:S1-C subfamily serine protease
VAEVIRTTAAMHEGFSGGAVFDMAGKVAGIATAGRIRGLGVIIPAAIARAAVDDLLKHGRRKRGYIGLAGQPIEVPERQRGDSGAERGVLIVSVSAGSPADSAGVLVGDILIEFDGRRIGAPEDLLAALAGDRAGQIAAARIIRGSAVQQLTVTIGERPDDLR